MTDVGETDTATASLPARPSGKQRRLARRAKRATDGKVDHDNTHAMAAEKNVTTSDGLAGKAKERLLKLQRATGITEELRIKLDAAHGLRIGYGEQNRPRAENVSQVPLAYYKQRGWISEQQFDAGNQFYMLWYYGAVRSGHVVSRDPRLPRGKANYEANEIMREKYTKAKKAIHGLPQALVAYNVCCIGEWASKLWPKKVMTEGDMGISSPDDLRPLYRGRDAKMEWLKEALDDLARHFTITEK